MAWTSIPQNHVFVYSRTNPQGIARGGTAAMLWEFDQSGKFVKEWGPHNYAASFAHSVRVDQHDNVWQVDEGSGMIVKYSPQAIPLGAVRPDAGGHRLSRADDGKTGPRLRGWGAPARASRRHAACLHPDGGVGTFNRPTDVAWDSHDNVFVTDGYGNSRVVKIAPGGHWLKWVGTWGTGPNQFNIVHSVAVDAQDRVYAADRNNHRIQVYDDDLNFIKSITGMGAPWGLCIPRADASGKQYIFSSDGTSGRLYKIDLASGKVVGLGADQPRSRRGRCRPPDPRDRLQGSQRGLSGLGDPVERHEGHDPAVGRSILGTRRSPAPR